MTADEINALPERVRQYVMELETRCDPSGDVRQLTQLRDQVRELGASNRLHRDRTTAAEALLASCREAMRVSQEHYGRGGTDWSNMIASIDGLLSKPKPKTPAASGPNQEKGAHRDRRSEAGQRAG